MKYIVKAGTPADMQKLSGGDIVSANTTKDNVFTEDERVYFGERVNLPEIDELIYCFKRSGWSISLDATLVEVDAS